MSQNPSHSGLELIVNGDPVQLPVGATVLHLIQTLELRSQYVAVEVNGALVVRQEHSEYRLQTGDQVELVTLVGGG